MVRFAMQTAEVTISPSTKRCKTNQINNSTPTLATSVATSVDGEDKPLAALFDPDTLDCGVCMEALSPPIFQVLSTLSDMKCNYKKNLEI